MVYINELKWKSAGACCSKCNNKELLDGPKKFSKKCKACGYVESLTENTLFHGLRFPIQKAFYLTYVVYHDKNYTLDELSEMLELRRNTCWNFKKKIQTNIDALPRDFKWADLILTNNE